MTDSLVHANPTLVVEDPPEPMADIQPASTGLDDAIDEREDDGLGRALVLGGLAGFVIVYLISFALFEGIADSGLVVAAGSSLFVGLFGGIGFGAMVGASLHH